MMVFAIALIVIAFWFSQNPVIFWALLGTSILSFVALSIFVSKYNVTPSNRGCCSKGYVTRGRRKKGSVLGAFAAGVKQAHRRSGSARRAYHRNSGVRCSINGLHRRKYKKHTFW